MQLTSEFAAVTEALSIAQIPYAVCGGIAVVIHGFARTTRDIDLLVLEADLERILVCVRGLNYNLDGGLIPLEFGEPFERNVYRVSKAEGRDLMSLDLVLVNPLLQRAWETRERYTWQGREIDVVSRLGLGDMKRLSGRPQDLVDLERLGIRDDDAANSPAG